MVVVVVVVVVVVNGATGAAERIGASAKDGRN